LVTAGIKKAAYRGVLDASTSPPKERYAVSKDNITNLIQPGNVTEILLETLLPILYLKGIRGRGTSQLICWL